MDPLYDRSALLIGTDKITKLAASRVAVFGIGGVGSFACEALARGGVGTIGLFDHDVVQSSNRNRQLVALESTIGKPKVEVMRDRILDINPNANVTSEQCFYSAENMPDLQGYDYIIDAIDTVTSKLLLITYAKAHRIPIISCMGAGNKLDPTQFEVSDIYKTSVCPLARIMRKELRARDVDSLKVVYSKEPPITQTEKQSETERPAPGSISFVPSVAGLILAGEVIKDLVK